MKNIRLNQSQQQLAEKYNSFSKTVEVMILKRTLGIVLVFVLLFSLAACANNNTSDQTQTSTESAGCSSDK